MKHLSSRTGAAATAPGLSLPATLGIAIGGALVGGTIIVVVILVIIRSRHRRAVTSLEQENATRQMSLLEAGYPNGLQSRLEVEQHSSLSQSSAPYPSRTRSPDSVQRSDNEIKVSSRRRSTKRPRKQPKLAVGVSSDIKARSRFRGLAHLSAIIESPRSDSPSTPVGAGSAIVEDLPMTLAESIASSSPLSHPRTPDSAKEDMLETTDDLRPGSLSKDIFKTLDMRLDFGSNPNFRPSMSNRRSISSPTVLHKVPEDGSPGSGILQLDSLPRARSLSAYNLRSTPGPRSPLPPLPETNPAGQDRPDIDFSTLRNSVSSVGSDNSSILGLGITATPPVLQDFATRHPELNLGLQVRHEASHAWKKTLIGGQNERKAPVHNTSASPVESPSKIHPFFHQTSAVDSRRKTDLEDDFRDRDSRANKDINQPSRLKTTVPGSSRNLPEAGAMSPFDNPEGLHPNKASPFYHDSALEAAPGSVSSNHQKFDTAAEWSVCTENEQLEHESTTSGSEMQNSRRFSTPSNTSTITLSRGSQEEFGMPSMPARCVSKISSPGRTLNRFEPSLGLSHGATWTAGSGIGLMRPHSVTAGSAVDTIMREKTSQSAIDELQLREQHQTSGGRSVMRTPERPITTGTLGLTSPTLKTRPLSLLATENTLSISPSSSISGNISRPRTQMRRNIFDTAPAFLPPRLPVQPRTSYVPGFRMSPKPEVMKSVQALRRMNSDANCASEMDLTKQRYLQIGSPESPSLSSYTLSSSNSNLPEASAIRSTDQYRTPRSSLFLETLAWSEDTTAFQWPTDDSRGKATSTGLGISGLNGLNGTVNVHGPSSLYDADGFLKF